jgi:hypothetical protein
LVPRSWAAVAQHWEQYRLSDERRQELRAAVLELFKARTAGAEQEIASQQARITAVRHEQQKAKEAYYHDALSIAEFKEEQQRHTRHLTSLEAIETGVDELLQLTKDPVAFYEAAADNIKRMLLQAVFEKIWIVDEQIVGVDLTRPFAEVLTVEAQLDLRDALSGTDGAMVTYERRERLSWRSPEFRSLFRYERPNGLLAIDTRKNLRHEKAEGSNSINLVGVTGFEPATSSSRTPRSSRLQPY